MFGTAWNKVLLTAQLMSGAYDFEPVCGQKLRDFLPIIRYISQTIQDIAMVAMEGE